MKCSKCGNEIANDSLFCEYCGTQIVKANTLNAECKVHVKWLLYVSMFFTCILNYFLFETQTYEAVMCASCLLLVQLGVFLPALFLRYKKRIPTLVLTLSFIMLVGNILLLVDANMFDGYIHWDSGFKLEAKIYGDANHSSACLILIIPLILFACMIYEFYSYKKTRQ